MKPNPPALRAPRVSDAAGDRSSCRLSQALAEDARGLEPSSTLCRHCQPEAYFPFREIREWEIFAFLRVFRVKVRSFGGHGALRLIAQEIFFFSAAVACGGSAKHVPPNLVVTDSPIGRKLRDDRTAREAIQSMVKFCRGKIEVCSQGVALCEALWPYAIRRKKK